MKHKQKRDIFLRTAYLKILIRSSYSLISVSYPHVVPNLYDFFSLSKKKRRFWRMLRPQAKESHTGLKWNNQEEMMTTY